MRVLVALVCLAACSSHREVRTPADLARLEHAVVYIQACGTGWMASNKFVVTNRHVADCVRHNMSGWATVIFASGYHMRGTIFADARGAYVDLALIELIGPVGAPHLELAREGSVHADDLLMAIGNPYPSRWVRSSYRVVGESRGVIVLEGSANHGDSGSPVVTRDGRVAGVLFARSSGRAYAVPVRPYLTDLLASIPRSSSPLSSKTRYER